MESCTQGQVFEEAPESTYTEVGVSGFAVRSRELFEDQIYAINWDKWVPTYMNQQLLGDQAAKWTNTSATAVKLSDGREVQPGGVISASRTVEDNAEAPEGKLHVLNMIAGEYATYQTANKGYLFDGSKFSGDFKLVDPVVNNRSEKVKLPVRKNEIVVDFGLVAPYNCIVEPVKDAPELGKPGDFTKPHRYLVKNIAYLPPGVKQYTRLYEVRVVFYPNK